MKGFSFGKTAAVIALITALSAGCGASSGNQELPADANPEIGFLVTNEEAIVSQIRQGLEDYAADITVRVTAGDAEKEELDEAVLRWMQEALAETDDPAAGDYIRYQLGGYSYSESYTALENGLKTYSLKIVPDYYCWKYQADEAEETIVEILASDSFCSANTDEEKVRAAYDYLCRNVKYDSVHKKHPVYHLRSTAYSALVMKTATCQGYCVSLYRLLKEQGIDARIVTGYAKEGGGSELHAWVLAKVDDLYYGLDPSWDSGKEVYDWYLKGSESLKERVLSEEFTAASFTEKHPMSAEDYEPAGQGAER